MPNLRINLVFEKYLSVRFCQSLKLPLVGLAVLLGLLHCAYQLTLVQFIAKSCNMTYSYSWIGNSSQWICNFKKSKTCKHSVKAFRRWIHRCSINYFDFGVSACVNGTRRALSWDTVCSYNMWQCPNVHSKFMPLILMLTPKSFIIDFASVKKSQECFDRVNASFRICWK